MVPQHQRPARPRREDHPPHQQGGDGAQAHAPSRETQCRLKQSFERRSFVDSIICRLVGAKNKGLLSTFDKWFFFVG